MCSTAADHLRQGVWFVVRKLSARSIGCTFYERREPCSATQVHSHYAEVKNITDLPLAVRAREQIARRLHPLVCL